MANAANYALRATDANGLASRAASACVRVIRDASAGALSSAKLLVMLTGCAALLAAGVLLSSEDARTAMAARLSAPPVAAAQVDEIPDAKGTDQRVLAATEDPRQKRLVQYLARRYRVADGAVQQLVAAAFQIGIEKKLDPLLILSVMAIESSLNPFAQSAMGAQGLMQVMTRVHAERFEPHGGETAALDPVTNMKVGSSILHDLISRGGSVERGLQLYVGAGNLPDDGGYGARVLGERSRLQLAATGKVDAAIVAAIRAAAPVPQPKPEAIPVNAETSAESSAAASAETSAELNVPPGPTFLLPLPNPASDAQELPAQAEQSV